MQVGPEYANIKNQTASAHANAVRDLLDRKRSQVAQETRTWVLYGVAQEESRPSEGSAREEARKPGGIECDEKIWERWAAASTKHQLGSYMSVGDVVPAQLPTYRTRAGADAVTGEHQTRRGDIQNNHGPARQLDDTQPDHTPGVLHLFRLAGGGYAGVNASLTRNEPLPSVTNRHGSMCGLHRYPDDEDPLLSRPATTPAGQAAQGDGSGVEVKKEGAGQAKRKNDEDTSSDDEPDTTATKTSSDATATKPSSDATAKKTSSNAQKIPTDRPTQAEVRATVKVTDGQLRKAQAAVMAMVATNGPQKEKGRKCAGPPNPTINWHKEGQNSDWRPTKVEAAKAVVEATRTFDAVGVDKLEHIAWTALLEAWQKKEGAPEKQLGARTQSPAGSTEEVCAAHARHAAHRRHARHGTQHSASMAGGHSGAGTGGMSGHSGACSGHCMAGVWPAWCRARVRRRQGCSMWPVYGDSGHRRCAAP